jgi:hypothetical protein
LLDTEYLSTALDWKTLTGLDVAARRVDDALPLLRTRAPKVLATAIELLIDTGRRPNEILNLSWDCLGRDHDDNMCSSMTTSRTTDRAGGSQSQRRPQN